MSEAIAGMGGGGAKGGGEAKGGKEKQPHAVRLELFGKRLVDAGELAQRIAGLGFTHIDAGSREVRARNIEGEDMKGRPHSYSSFLFREDGIVFEYAVPEGANRRKRDIEMCKLLLSTIAGVDCYELEFSELYRFMAQALEHATEFATLDYERLMNKHELLGQEHAELRRNFGEIRGSADKNSAVLLETQRQNMRLRERVARLEGMDDQTLGDELFAWIRAHNGFFDAAEFAKAYGVGVGRVEEGLEKLLKEGYIGKG